MSTRSLKILLVHDYAFPFGGAEVIVHDTRRLLRERGHDARLFTSTAGMRLHSDIPFDPPDYSCPGTLSRFRTLLQTVNPFAHQAMARALDDFRPDIVHVKMFLTQLSPAILPLLRPYASLLHVVWYRPFCPTGTRLLPNHQPCTQNPGRCCLTHGCVPLRDYPLHMAQMNLLNRYRQHFSTIVANSNHVKNELLRAGWPCDEVLYSCVTHEFPHSKPLTPYPSAVYAGRLVPEKGVHLLINAFGQLLNHFPEAQLLICGDGPERTSLQQFVTQKGWSSHITFLGHIARNRMEERFAGTWVQVVPSIWAEPLGLVAIEAMQRGSAVIASNTGGLAEIVLHGETGLSIPPDDASALTNALHTLFSDPATAAEMGKKGQIRARQTFSEKAMVTRLLQIYDRMLAQPPRRSQS